MTEHMFVDESKKGGFLMVAACFAEGDLDESRMVMRDLVQPGQERLHFTKERLPGPGPRADHGGHTFSRWSNCTLSRAHESAKPGSPTVRKATELASQG